VPGDSAPYSGPRNSFYCLGHFKNVYDDDDDDYKSIVCPKKCEPLNILQQQLQICSDLNKILHTQDDIC